jgi:hypothetical protein
MRVHSSADSLPITGYFNRLSALFSCQRLIDVWAFQRESLF